MNLEHMPFDRIDFEKLTLYDLQEAVDGETDDLILTIVEMVIDERLLRSATERIVDNLPVPNGQTFAEAQTTRNALVNKIIDKALSFTDEPF